MNVESTTARSVALYYAAKEAHALAKELGRCGLADEAKTVREIAFTIEGAREEEEGGGAAPAPLPSVRV